MFRKKQDVAERSRSLLKSSAAKKIKADILIALPLLSKETLDELMPTKDGIEIVKLASRALVYVHVPSKTPMFFDTDGRSNLFPTVYALWRVQSATAGDGACCLPLVVHPPVSKFILNGADVMLPGVVRKDLASVDYVIRERRCVMSSGNPSPYAVGEMLKDREGVIHGGMTGKGLKVVHCYLDFLWQMGPRTLPNDGFRPDGVYSLVLESEEDVDHVPEGGPEEDAGGDDGGSVPDAWEMLAEPSRTVPTAAATADARESAKENVDGGLGLEGVSLKESEAGRGGNEGVAKAAGERDEGNGRPAVPGGAEGAEAKVEEGGEEEGEVAEEEESASVMEERLVWAFLNGLKKTLKDKELPMLVSTFYSSVLLPSRPPGTSIDVKKTRFRKISNFLGEMEGRGFVTLQESKGVQSLVAVSRSHPELRRFKASAVTAGAQAAEEAAAAAAAGGGGSGGSGGDGGVSSVTSGLAAAAGVTLGGSGEMTTKAFELYKLSHNVKKMLGSELASSTGKFGEYLTPSEARDVLFAYIRLEGLEHPTDRSLVVPNGPLCDNLYKPMNKKAPPVEYPTEVKKANLPGRFLERLQLHHAIVLPGSDRPMVGRGGIPTVSIEVEKRQGNRHATKVRGLEAYGIDPAALGRQVQKRFACSTSSQPVPGTNGKYQELMLQGHLATDMEELLSAEMGIPRRFLSTGFSKGAKPRKSR